MTPARREAGRGALALVGVIALGAAATCLGVVIGEGNPVIAVGPLLGLVFLWGVWNLPVRTTLLGMMFCALALDSPHERPMAGLWRSPLYPLGELFFENMHKTLHLPPLRFSGLEGLLLYLVVIIVYRRATGRRLDPAGPTPPRPLAMGLMLSFGALLWLEVYGKLRGGDLKESIWQLRVLLSLPVAAYLFSYAFQGAKDLAPVWKVIIAAAFLKVAMGAYFYFVVCRQLGRIPPYVTSHGDSVLFVVAIMACFALWWEKPNLRHAVICAGVFPVVFLGLVINDRRLAYVSLAAAVITVYLVSPWNRVKRFVARAALLCLPLSIPYAAIGWRSTNKIFKPVTIFRSVVSPDSGSVQDSSTEFRDLENFNLIYTLNQHPFLGAGFGHEYVEVERLPDISKWMPNYRFLPHNGVLWLWTLGGWLGFTGLWLYLGLLVFFAARTYPRLTDPRERAAMLVTLCIVVAYLNQCFGDMGTQTYNSVFLLGPALAIVGKLAISSGAWRNAPAPARVPAPPGLSLVTALQRPRG